MMGEVSKLCEGIKNRAETKILLSGTHPSALPIRTLEETACDYVARGEGFNTPLDLLNNKELKDVRGLWFKQEGKIVRGAFDSPLSEQDLDKEFTMAAWDLLDLKKYRAHNWHCLNDIDKRQPYASIYTSFGCPFDCVFCCINAPFNEEGTKKNTLRRRNPKKVLDELEFLSSEGVKNIKIIDEMFVFHPKHYVEIAKGITERGLDFNIWAYARIDTVHEKYLDVLKKAGFNWLALGIESGSENVRDGSSKKIEEQKIHNVVKRIQDSGINVIGNYIFGLPDDTTESMQKTLSLAQELNCEWANFYCAMAYPGSRLHSLVSNRKIPLPKNWPASRPLLPEEDSSVGWEGYSQHSYLTLPLPTQTLHPEQVLEFRDKAFLSYFSNPSFISMIKGKFGEKAASYSARINNQTFKRKILGDSK